MTQYIYKGQEISHTSFIALCQRNGVNGGRRMSHYAKLVDMSNKGNERATNVLKDLEVREVGIKNGGCYGRPAVGTF